jgi:ABC-type glycerol-3-phosphate transport system substrate-binding protein
MAIPRGARNADDAWEFIRFLSHDPEGTTLVGHTMGVFPGVRDAPYYDEVREKPRYRDYYKILESTQHQRPVMPVQNFYMRELGRAVEASYYQRLEPAEALATARKNTQAELDLALTG